MLLLCVLQGTVQSTKGTVRCGRKYDMDLVANFIKKTIVKEFLKICQHFQSYEQMYNGTFFIHCVHAGSGSVACRINLLINGLVQLLQSCS